MTALLINMNHKIINFLIVSAETPTLIIPHDVPGCSECGISTKNWGNNRENRTTEKFQLKCYKTGR